MSASRTEIESLIYLLDDPDPEVQDGVESRFRELGEHAVPLLDQFRSRSVSESEKVAIGEILHKITFASLYEDFVLLLNRGVDNRRRLEEAIFLLARFGNPTLHTYEYRRKLDRFAGELSVELQHEATEIGKVRLFLKYVFNELGFRGDQKEYHNPENALIDRVIDRRKGLPISLSLIVIFLGQRLGFPFFGVNMPIHFMVSYQGEEKLLIDPFDGGTIVTYDQCHYFLKKNGILPKPEHLSRCDEPTILHRFLRNLIHSYSKSGNTDRLNDLKLLLGLIEQKGGVNT